MAIKNRFSLLFGDIATTNGWVPLFELDKLAEVAEDRHEADCTEVERRQ